jgi:small-conductance mechanosensitive channel
MRSSLRLFLLVTLLLAAAVKPGLAAAPASPADGTPQQPVGLTNAEAHQLLTVLQNPQKRDQLITTLKNLEKVMPVLGAAAASPPPAAAKPAAASTVKHTVSLKPNSLGADVLTGTGTLISQMDTSLATTVTSVTDYREFGFWVRDLSEDPTLLTSVLDASWRLFVVLVVAFVFEFVAWRVTRSLYDRLGQESRKAEATAAADAANHLPTEGEVPLPETVATARTASAPQPSAPTRGLGGISGRAGFQRLRPLQTGWLLLKRLPFILLAMALDAVPPLVFLAFATLVLTSPIGGDPLIRLTITSVVNAYVVCRLLLVAARGTVCAPTAKLRLLHVSNDAASFLTVWCRRIALVIVVGAAIIQIGSLSGMSLDMQHGLGRLVGLVMHCMLIVMVLKRRREVEAWLRGHPTDERSFWGEMKGRIASVWHIQAIILIVLVWIVYATEVARGIGHPLHLILVTMGLLILFRILSIIILGGLDKLFATGTNTQTGTRYALINARAMRYHSPLRTLVNIAMAVIFFLILFQTWGVDAWQWFEVGGLGGRLLSSVGTILVTLIVAVIVWETINFVTQIYMDDLSQKGAYVRAARLRTVMPVLRNTLLIALLVVIALTALSEIGVNIAPLLAGASILGVAIGFGSQKLVQDFITGIFLLLENAMQVGDTVTAAGLSGTVENLSIRTLRLRAGDGSVHLIPFSSVSTVTNSNRGLGNAAVSVTVSYEEDTDAVAEILKQIAIGMRQDDAFKAGILSDFQFWGVDRVDGTTATLVGQVVCTDGGRWGVQREFNRRIKLAFQEKGVRLMPSASIMGFQHPLDVRVELPEMPGREAGGPQTIEATVAEQGHRPPAEARPAEARPAEVSHTETPRARRAGGSGS